MNNRGHYQTELHQGEPQFKTRFLERVVLLVVSYGLYRQAGTRGTNRELQTQRVMAGQESNTTFPPECAANIHATRHKTHRRADGEAFLVIKSIRKWVITPPCERVHANTP